jgi:DNA-binding FadR family transcriptional regulator
MTIPRESIIRTPKWAELIAEAIRAGIEAGTYLPGDRIPGEGDLAVSFGASRPSVREALRVLESEQLITVRRGACGGPVITVPSVAAQSRQLARGLLLQGLTGSDLREATTALETASLRALAAQSNRRVLGDLSDSVDAVGSDFHHELVLASGNPALIALTEALRAAAASQRLGRNAALRRALTASPCRDAGLHREVVRLVARGSASGAERTWYGHVAALRVAS